MFDPAKFNNTDKVAVGKLVGRLVILSGPSCVGKGPFRAALAKFEVRATSAYGELKQAWRFAHVIPNHDGEDSEHCDALYFPVGDARKALHAFAQLLRGEAAAYAENWEKELVP